jgi:hypothetical protein
MIEGSCDDDVYVIVTCMGTNMVRLRADWSLIKSLADIIETTSEDGTLVVLLHQDDADFSGTTIFPGNCVPKLKRKILALAQAYRHAEAIQKRGT